jgi:hypothetical protein
MNSTTRGQLKKVFSAIVLTAMVAFGFASSFTQVVNAASAPNIISYQGRVTDANGTPVTDTSLEMEFFFYDALESGNCIWSNTSDSCDSGDPDLNAVRTVSLSSGLFSELLGDVDDAEAYAAITDSIFGDNASVYLEVVIEEETLTPRKRLAAVPYALNADTLDGIDSTAWLQSANNLSDVGDTSTTRTNLGLSIGTDVQAYDADLDGFAGLTDADSAVVIGTGSGWTTESGPTLRSSLGLAIGTNVQAYDADLSAIAGLTEADSTFIVGTGSGWVAESGATVRTSLGLGALALLGTVDISDNTNLAAGTNITLTDDTLSVDDAFLLNTGDTGSGDYLFSGSFDLTPATNIDALDISGTNVTSGSALDIDSGNTSGNVIDLALNPATSSTANGIALSSMPATSATLSGDLLLITMDAVDADGVTGDGLKIVVDQSQVSGYPIMVETDAAQTVFSVTDSGLVTSGSDFHLGGSEFVAAAGLNISTGNGQTLSLETGTTGTINIGTDGSAEAINIGTGAAVKTITFGSSTTTSATTIQSGSGNLTLDADAVTGSQIIIDAYDVSTNTSGSIDLDAGSGGMTFDTVGGGMIFTSGTTIALNATNDLDITSGIDIDLANAEAVRIDSGAATTSDSFVLSTTTAQDNVNGFVLNYTSSTSATGDGVRINASFSDTSDSTNELWKIIDIASPTAVINTTSDVATLSGVNIGNLSETETSGTINSAAMYIGTGWDKAIEFGANAILDIPNAGSLAISDGTNTLFTFTDQGTYASLDAATFDANATDSFNIDVSNATGISVIGVAADSDSEDLKLVTSGSEGDIIIDTIDDFTLDVDAGSVIDIADNLGAKTIHIGGVDGNGTDTIAIGTQATAADTITIGNTHASTVLSLIGGDTSRINFTDFDVTATGATTIVPDSDVTALTLTGTNVTSVGLAYLNQPNDAAGAVLEVESASNSGPALLIDQNDDATALQIDSENLQDTVVDIDAANTTGNIVDITANSLISGGNVLQISADALAATGNIIDVTSASRMTGAVDFFSGVHLGTITADATTSGDMIDLQRTLTQNNGGTTNLMTGSVASFARDLTGTAGTIQLTGALLDLSNTASGNVTDSANMLAVAQNYSSASGRVINVLNEGTGDAIFVDQNGDGMSLNIDSSATSAGVIRTTSMLNSGSIYDINMQPVGASTANIFDIDLTTGPVSGNVFDVNFGSTAHSGNAIDIDMGTNVTGDAIQLANSASSGALFAGTSTLSDATSGVYDFNATSDTDSVEGINLGFTVQDDNDNTTETFAALDITATQNSNDAVNDDHLYGLHINDLAGSAQTGNEYAIYQEGTSWDYGIYAADEVYLASGITTVGNAVFQGLISSDQTNIDFNIDSASANYIDIGADVWSTGKLLNIDYDTAELQTGSITGVNVDLATNLTLADGQDTRGVNIEVKSAQSTTAVTTDTYGLRIGVNGSLTQSTAAGTINYYGAQITTPTAIENTGTIKSYGIQIDGGQAQGGADQYGLFVKSDVISGTGGTQTGYYFDPGAVASGVGEQRGIHIGDASSSNATIKRGLQIDAGYDQAIYVTNGSFAVDSDGDMSISSVSGDDSIDVLEAGGSFTGDVFELESTTSGSGFNLIRGIANSSTVFTLDGAGTITANIPNSGSYTAALCWDNSGLSQIQDCVGSVLADYAEQYPVASDVSYGDVVKLGATDVVTTTGETIKQLVKADSPYEANIVGVVSNNYGDFSSTGYNIDEGDNPMPVALVGRIPVNVTDENGSIEAGDPLTTSSTEGYAMKSTGAGMIIGYALEDHATGDGQIMFFVDNGWHASGSIITDGENTLISDDIIAIAKGEADASTNYNSHGFSLRGSAWDGAAAEDVAMTLINDVNAIDDYRLSIRNNAETEVAYVTNDGTLSVSNDVIISGKLYPSDRGATQTSKYIYYDGSSGMGGDFMRTNASGWATGSYDFAEMFPSTETLEAGDVVVFSGSGANVRRGTDGERKLTAGIVSTRPGFLAGDNVEGDYPIALAGRVPTKVTLENGPIAVGDPLTLSTLSGYAMRATDAGMVVGYALEPYTTPTSDASIITFVNVGYYDGGEVTETPGVTSVVAGGTHSYSGLSLTGDIFMTGYQMRGIGQLAGMGDIWGIEQDGSIKTQATLTTVTRSFTDELIETAALTSSQVMITLSGTSRIEAGEKTIRFETIDPTFNDIISMEAPMYAVVTPHGPSNLYVSHKDQNSFTVKQFGGIEYVNFDWVVMAYRKGYDPEALPEVEIVVEEEEEEEVVIEEVVEEIEEEGVVDEAEEEVVVEEDSVDEEEEVVIEEVIEEIEEEGVVEEVIVEEIVEEEVVEEIAVEDTSTQEELVVEEDVASPESPVEESVIIPTGSSDDGGETAQSHSEV